MVNTQPQEKTTGNQEANFRSSTMTEFQKLFQDMADQNREQIHKLIEEKMGPILKTITPPCSYKTFLSCQPPEFSGSTGTTAILNWITKMELVFDLCECGESQKVKFAVSMLKGNAWSWWKVTRVVLGKEPESHLTWGEFVEKVKERYCFRMDLAMIETEVFRLEKGNMTIEEYACLLVEKLQYVGNLASTDEYCVAFFSRGLPSEYSMEVENAETLNKAISKAKMVEYHENESIEEEDVGEKRKWGGTSGSFKKSKREVKSCY